MYRLLFLLPLLVVALFPDSAAAQLVTCSGDGGITAGGTLVGDPCGTCEFVAMVKNVLGFITLLASIIATITLVYVGLRLVTSGGNEQVKAEVKTALWNIVLGLFFIISAFAIVDAVMRALVTDSSLLNWDRVECLYARQPTTERYELATITLAERTVNYACERIAADQFDCSSQRQKCERGDGVATEDRSDPMNVGIICDYPPVTYENLPEVTGVNLCNNDYLGTHFSGEERIAQCVLQGESSCGADFYSTTDKAQDENGRPIPFSVSPWQINLSVWDIEAGDNCGGALSCTSAFRGTDYGAVLTNRDLYNQCIDALRNEDCSGSVASRIRSTSRGWRHWSAYTRNRCGG